MSINGSNLSRTVRKDGELSKKLISVRKKRDDEAKKINTITKKKNVTRSDLQRLERYQKNLLKYEKEMTELMEKVRKNTDDLNRYKERVDKEQKREYEKMMKTIESQTNMNENYMNSVSEVSERLNELAIDVKH